MNSHVHGTVRSAEPSHSRNASHSRNDPPGDAGGRHHRTRSELAERDGEPMSADHRGVNPTRDLTQLVQRRVDLVTRVFELSRRAAVAGELLLEQTQLERERNEPVLGAVMQIALQSLPLPLTGFDDPRARAA